MTLPKGWVEATIGDVADTKLGKMLDAAKNKGIPVPYLRNINVRWGEFDLSDLQEMKVTSDELIELAVRNGDLFVCEGGEPGRSAVWRGGDHRVVFQKALHRIRTLGGVEPDFVARHLGFAASKGGFADLLTGTTIKHLPQVALQRMAIPLPPAAEQSRIVAKVDALTARIARARVELDRMPVLAKRQRECAVRSAFRGDLTAKWRKAHTTPPAASYSSDLPQGWVWTSLGQLAEIKSGLTLGKKRAAGTFLVKMPYLRVANVQRGSLDLSVIKEVPVTVAEAEALRLHPGDILLNEGGDRDKLGRGWVWEGQIPNCLYQNHVFRARLRDSECSPFYVSLYANEFGQDYFIEHGTQTTNLASINKKKVSALPIPLASLAEQREIIRRLQSMFARADRLEAEAARARALLDRLEAAILGKAFRGELVPQDPNDEPASVLLDRIRAQRAAAPKRGRRASLRTATGAL